MVSLITICLFLVISLLFINASLANVICEDLPTDICAFSVSAAGQRCLLETEVRAKGVVEYQCRTSAVEVERIANYVESDACVHACGVDRRSLGISSDALLESDFTATLCSPECYDNCPNIIDLYSNLVAGEGAFLPDVCAARRFSPHRSMIEILSSGSAPAPIPDGPSQTDLIDTPAPAPM